MTGAAPAQGFLDEVLAFAESTIALAAPGWSMGEEPDPALFMQAARIGLTGMTIPAAHGGRGYAFSTLVEACEILAAIDFGFAMSVVNTHNVGARLCLSAPQALCQRYLPRLISGEIGACTALTEPGAGSDFAAITTRAIETRSGWRITGEKTWIVNGRRAGLAIVFAQCGTVGDAAGIGGFLVDLSSKGVQRHAIDSAFSQTSTGTGGFVLDGVDVEADCLLLPPGGAFKSILTEINAARTYVAAMVNAMLDKALSTAVSYGARRTSFGRPLNQHQGWRAPIGAAETDLAASQALTARAVALIETGQDAQRAAAEAKVAAVQACQRHLPELMHAMGAEGLRPEHCFARHLAAAQIAGFTDGATSILRDRVARLACAATTDRSSD